MFPFHVLSEIADVRIRRVAHAAGVRLLADVSAHVGVAHRPLVEPPIAQIALVAATAVRRVLRHLVILSRLLLVKPVAADAARVQPIAAVGGEVQIQQRHALELLLTLLTAIQSLVGVLQHVALEPVGRRKRSRALPTFVRPPTFVHESDMFIAATGPSEPFPALVALVAEYLGVQSHMGLEVTG